MLSKILGLGLFGQNQNISAQDEIVKQENGSGSSKRRRRLNTRHWRDRKGKHSSASSVKENVPPVPRASLAKGGSQTWLESSDPSVQQRSPLALMSSTKSGSPLRSTSSSSSSSMDMSLTSLPLSPTGPVLSPTTLSSVRRLRIENTNLKKKVVQLENELSSYKLQAAEDMAVLEQQIGELKAKLGRRSEMKRSVSIPEEERRKTSSVAVPAKKATVTIAVEEKKGTQARKEAASNKLEQQTKKKRRLTLRNKKAKTGGYSAVSETVVPLAQLAVPPPAPPAPPAIVISSGEAQTAETVQKARKNLKRRASDVNDKASRVQRKKPEFPPSLNDVLSMRNTLKPASRREKPAAAPEIDDYFKAALLKKFENANVYSPMPASGEANDSFTFYEPPSPYRPL